ncbi:MAG: tetratricopeptide repeat protein [Desulfobulbaceae bacterium]|nr:tetratricopeptide repeat protein [Desulfobulbaceae bacterium]
MTDQSAFSKKKIETLAPEKTNLLEEMNLPPQVISFLRKNSKNLQIGIACIVIALIGSSVYKHFAEVKKEKSTALLAAALVEETPDTRQPKLEDVLKDYSDTAAARWAMLQLGHDAYEAEDYPKAIENYTKALEKLSSSDSLTPFVQYDLAYAYEENKDFDKALSSYADLAKTASFAAAGYLGMGRVYEKKQEWAQAKDSYEKARSYDAFPVNVKGWVDGKVIDLSGKLKIKN